MTSNVVVSRIILFSKNMDKVVEFYNAIGLNLAKTHHGWGPDYSYLDVLENNEQHFFFEIFPLPELGTEAPTVMSPQVLGFATVNLPDVINKLMGMGAPLVRPKILERRPGLASGCTLATFKDPDGRVVTITQHGHAKPA